METNMNESNGRADDVKSGELDFIEFMETHKPDGVIWDIATARSAVRRYNENHISLVPAAPGANLGLSIAGRF